MSKIKSVIADYKLLLNSVPALITVVFVLGTVWMNLAAGKIMFSLGNVSLTGGFILSWLPFLCMDTVTKRFGARASIMLNILSAVGNAIVVILFAIVAAIPTEADYSQFNYVFSGVWFIALSSTLAFIISGVANSLINASIGKLFKNKTSAVEFYSRSYVSTFIGQAIDNFLFMFLTYVIFAPIFWHIPAMPVLTCIGTAIIGGFIELLAEVVISPIGFKIVKNWERDNVGHDYIEAHPQN